MAEELNRPLSYLDWVQATEQSTTTESDLFFKYSQYATNWYQAKNLAEEEQRKQVRNLYASLLRDVTLNYANIEERRYLSNVDYSNPKELDSIIPFFVTKLKQITQYLVRKRQDVSFAKMRHSLKGSEAGVQLIVRDTIVSLLENKDFIERYPRSYMPAVSTIVNDLAVEIEPLYDTYQDYFDTDPTVPVDMYASPADATLYDSLSSNTESTDYKLWLDLTSAIEDIFEDMPVLLQVGDGEGGLSSSDNIGLALNFPRSDIDQLPYSYFTDVNKTLDNFSPLFGKQLVEKYAGAKMYYLSAGKSATDPVTGVLFDPQNPEANILNRYYSSHATVASDSNVEPLKTMGGFFTPTKIGVLNYTSVDSYYEIDKSKIEPDTVYIYPDPEMYGTGRGNTKTDQYSVLQHTDVSTSVKASRADGQLHGDIVNDSHLQKFYPYQSREETLGMQPAGISRSVDNIDFWEGDANDVWANSDVYTPTSLRDYPINERQQDLLISDHILYEWKTDIYGNEYALYKDTHPLRQTTEQQNDNFITTATQTIGNVGGARQMFDPPATNYYDYQLSKFTTTYENKTSALTASQSIYSQQQQLGHLFFRNSHSTVIDPLSTALSGVFIKYQGSDILTQINNEIKHFDIIDDVIIVQTTDFMVIERYRYNHRTDAFTSTLPKQLFISISGSDPNFNKFGNIWYNDRDNDIILFKTTIHPYLSASNYKIIYPIIYSFDIANQSLVEIYSLGALSGEPIDASLESQFNLLSSEGFLTREVGTTIPVVSAEHINITNIGIPIASHNTLENTYSVSYFGHDSSCVSYLYNLYFDSADKLKFRPRQLDMFKPNSDVFNYSVGNYYRNKDTKEPGLSGYIEGPLNRGGLFEGKAISYDARQTTITLPGIPAHNMVFDSGIPSSALSDNTIGRSINPTRVIDTDNNTIRLGAGLSANDHMEATPANNENLTTLSAAPYSHSSSYLLFNPALSGNNSDIMICFDFALYTNTSANSAYAQIALNTNV